MGPSFVKIPDLVSQTVFMTWKMCLLKDFFSLCCRGLKRFCLQSCAIGGQPKSFKIEGESDQDYLNQLDTIVDFNLGEPWTLDVPMSNWRYKNSVNSRKL